MVNWDLILDTIEDEKCVLVMGPEMRLNNEGKQINKELYYSLDIDNNQSIKKFYEVDELFLFSDGMSKTMVYYQIKKFLDSCQFSEIYQKIAELPFHLYISVNNDLVLPEIFKSNDFLCDFNFYNKTHLSQNIEAPSKNKPLIYNIMGSIDNEESLILDYDDLLEFLFSVLGNKPLPLDLKNSLQNASNFIFLGFSFEMKFLQILLKILNYNMKHKIKFAFNKDLKSSIKTFYIDQFKINFYDGEISNFVAELHTRFKEKGRLRRPLTKGESLHDKIEKLIAENCLLEALNELKIYFKKYDESDYNTIIILLSRLNALEDKIIARTISNQEIDLEKNRLRAAIIDLTNKIKENL